MDRAGLEQQLAQAEEHVALGAHNVMQQRALLSELEQDGRDTTEAKRLLANFEELQATQLVARDKLQHDLQAFRYRHDLQAFR